MMCKPMCAILLLTGLYADAQLYGAKHAQADPVIRRGTVTCAGKAYHDIVFATITGSAGIQLVRMWTVEAKNLIATRHTTPKWALTINNEMLCEFEDVNVHIIDPSISSSADGD